jgi:adenylosuccinate lyase
LSNADDGTFYRSPLVTRYAGRSMAELFSPRRRTREWRRLWVALAQAEQELGLEVSAEQVQELLAGIDTVDFARVAELERELRHDVMAHVHHYGEVCPGARGIIHLGATSCYVTDNADLLLLREGLGLLRGLLLKLIDALRVFAARERATPCLGWTHFQPAQFTTVGKRAALWIQDLLLDEAELRRQQEALPFLGVKGTTGTQASFLKLFAGDHDKVCALDDRVAELMGFSGRLLPISAQTYPRKLDHSVLSAIVGAAVSISKMAHDVRLLQSLGELSEPFGSSQIGSSAMAYKKNPMRSERMCSLARYVITVSQSAPLTASVQWLERTLDDSAIRRLALPEAFLGLDALLRIATNVASGLNVHPAAIRRHLDRELPFIATEDLLMAAVKLGGDRQDLHERIRQHAIASKERLHEEGGVADLFDRLRQDPAFDRVAGEIDAVADPARYVGRAPEQVDSFLAEHVEPRLAEHAELLRAAGEESVALRV